METKKLDSNTIRSAVIAIIAKQLEKDAATIDQSRSLLEQGADDLDCIEIVMRVEEQFGLEINDDDADALISIDAISAYVQSRC